MLDRFPIMFDRVIGAVACFILLALLSCVTSGVVTRALGDPLVWTDEVARFLTEMTVRIHASRADAPDIVLAHAKAFADSVDRLQECREPAHRLIDEPRHVDLIAEFRIGRFFVRVDVMRLGFARTAQRRSCPSKCPSA